MEVVKTENMKRELSDVDSSSTIKVNSYNKLVEQTAFRCDVIPNKVSSESTKYENSFQKEDNTSDDTKINIKSEIDVIDEVLLKHELSYDQLKPIKAEDSKTERDDEYVEQTAEESCLSSNTDFDHGQNVGDIETIKRKQNVEKEDTYSGIEVDMEKQNVIQQCQSNCCEYEAGDVATNCKHKTKIVHQPQLPVYKINVRSAWIKGILNRNIKYLKCLFCEYITKDRSNLRSHFRRKHNENSELYHCFNCEYRTKVKNDLVKHCRMQHNKLIKWHKCHLCDFITKYKRHLLQHHRLQHDGSAEIFQCVLCDFRTKYKGSLLAHRKLKHDNAVEVLHCELCDFKTKRKYDLSKHHRLKHDKK